MSLCPTCVGELMATGRAALDVLDDLSADPTERTIAADELADAARWLRLPILTASEDAP